MANEEEEMLNDYTKNVVTGIHTIKSTNEDYMYFLSDITLLSQIFLSLHTKD